MEDYKERMKKLKDEYLKSKKEADNDPMGFDTFVRLMMAERLIKKLESKYCLKDRELDWFMNLGFIIAHIIWFQKLGDKSGINERMELLKKFINGCIDEFMEE